MKRLIKDHVIEPLARISVPRLARLVHLPGRLAVLMYHAVPRAPLPVPDWCFVPVESFTAQMRYLRAHFEVLPLVEAVERLRAGRLTRPTAVLTFDDGYRDNHDVAFPILRELGLPATIFLNTGLVDTGDTVWFCRLHKALCETERTEVRWGGVSYDLRGPAARSMASGALQDRLKALDPSSLVAEVGRISATLGVEVLTPLSPSSPFRMLGSAEIAALSASGMIDFGAHTHTHAILTRLSPAQRREEIARSVHRVAAITGRPCTSFAYPNGQPQDYGQEDRDLLVELGVKVAVCTVEGPNVPGTSVLDLRRYGVGPELGLMRFAWLVHHLARP